MVRVIAAASPHDFAAGDTIIKKGDTNGSALFIILEGNVVCTDIGDGDAEECPLAAGDYFGELALMGTGAPRAATVTARSPTTCMAVERAAFVRVVGTLAKVLETNAVVRTIRAAPSFRLLATDVLEYLVASCTETVVEHGGVFMRAGEKINGMVVCKSGELSYAGRVVAANQYFFESSLYSEEIVDEDVKVSGASPTEPARFLVIARDAVERMIGQPLAQYRGKEALTLASLQRAEGLGGGLGRRRRSYGISCVASALRCHHGSNPPSRSLWNSHLLPSTSYLSCARRRAWRVGTNFVEAPILRLPIL
jgi:hypothetical protein